MLRLLFLIADKPQTALPYSKMLELDPLTYLFSSVISTLKVSRLDTRRSIVRSFSESVSICLQPVIRTDETDTGIVSHVHFQPPLDLHA
jgi:hypothetical protein